MKQEYMMQGLIPNSDEFMSWDPEQVDSYYGWQKFNKIVHDDKIIVKVSERQDTSSPMDVINSSEENI